jgi:hypothetical protein
LTGCYYRSYYEIHLSSQYGCWHRVAPSVSVDTRDRTASRYHRRYQVRLLSPGPEPRGGGGFLGTQAAGRAVPVEASRRTVVSGWLVLKA